MGSDNTKNQIFEKMYEVVIQIPAGSVATYGQIAFLAGFPRAARMAGQAMANAPEYNILRKPIPCHRVVNSRGECAACFPGQKDALMLEGITFLPNGCVNLKKHLWQPISK